MQAEETFKKYFSNYGVKNVELVGESQGKVIQTYNFEAKDSNGVEIYAQIAKKGGALVEFNYFKECSSDKIDQATANDIAERFLKSVGYDNLKAVWTTGGGNVVTINAPGTYELTGSLTNGQIIVDTLNKGDVFLVLAGINVHCENSAPIFCKQAKNLYVVLEKDTENYISDGKNYVFAPGQDEPDAALFSKDDLFIMGEGSLFLPGNEMLPETGFA